tara:strand:- start:657 stop:998 length:342 start_codon:yes stop_codon:yes gene_type:complete
MPKPESQVTKDHKQLDTVTFSGTSSAVINIGGDRPIKGLFSDLSTSGAMTFLGVNDAGGEFKVLGSDGTELSIDTASLTENFRFYPEFGPLKRIKVINATSQVNATITPVVAS